MREAGFIRKISRKNAVFRALLLIEVITAVTFLVMTFRKDFTQFPPASIISLTLDGLCMIFGVALFAGAMATKEYSGLFLAFAFVNHVIMTADASFCMATNPTVIYYSAAVQILAEIILGPILVLELRVLAGYGKKAGQLIRSHSVFDRIEFAVFTAGSAFLFLLWLLNFRTGILFYINEDGVYTEQPLILSIYVLTVIEQILLLFRTMRTKLSTRVRGILILMLVLPWFLVVINLAGYPITIGQVFIFICQFALFGELYANIRKEKTMYEDVLETYLTPELDETLLEQFGNDAARKVNASVLHSDLRGFTAQSETFSTEETVTILNRYLEAMMKVISEEGGIVAEFLGDGLLAIFGADGKQQDHAQHALAAALRMQLAMEEVNVWNRDHGYPGLRMGIGVGSGEMVFGKIGSSRLARLMAVGEEVGDTFGAESYALGGEVILTNHALCALGDLPVVEESFERIDHLGNSEKIHRVKGFKGREELTLHGSELPFVEFDEPLPLEVMTIEGKHISEKPIEGKLFAISPLKARIRLGRKPEPKHYFRFHLEEAFPGDYYARTTADVEGDILTVDLTGIPNRMEEIYEEKVKK